MSTSGVTEYSTSGVLIVTDAYQSTGAVDIEEGLSAAMLTYGLRMLNRMIKQWQTRGVSLHFNQNISIPLISGRGSYTIGYGQTSPNINVPRPMRITHLSRRTSTAYGTSTDSLALTVASQAFTVAEDLAFEADQEVIIATPAGKYASGTVISYTGTTLTIDITSVDNAATAAYWLIYTDDTNDIEVTQVSRNDYERLTTKTSSGTPVQAYYDRQSTYGIMKVWPVPSDSDSSLYVGIERSVEVFDDSEDTPDFPTETELALVYGLSEILCDALDRPAQKTKELKMKATDYFNQMLMTDQENTSIFVQPAR